MKHQELAVVKTGHAVSMWLSAYRRPLIVVFHFVLIAISSYAAIWLRFDGHIPAENWQSWLRALPWLLALRAVIFAWFGLYHGFWRYAGIWDLKNIVNAVLVGSASSYLLIQGLFGWND